MAVKQTDPVFSLNAGAVNYSRMTPTEALQASAREMEVLGRQLNAVHVKLLRGLLPKYVPLTNGEN